MNSHFNIAHFIKLSFFSLLYLTLFSMLNSAFAEPYLAVKNQVQCSACHINPIGGGMRSTFGNAYGHMTLPVDVSDFTSSEVGKINDLLSLGGNFRYNAEHSSDDADNTSSTFKVDSAQIYLAVTPKNSGITFYLDQQVAPGAAINREAFVLYKYGEQNYIKAGKMYVPYGLRLEDDTAFVRQATGFNFDSSDNGVEWGLNFDNTLVNLFITNGTGSVSNNDTKFLYGARAEHRINGYLFGSTLVLNDSENEQQTFFNFYGGKSWGKFTFLTEADYIVTDKDLTGANEKDSVKQLVGLFEVNYEWQKGINLKFTSEYFDPDTDISNNQDTRYSFVGEYTPISNLQLRMGLRSSDSIPQLPERSGERFFIQTHLYF